MSRERLRIHPSSRPSSHSGSISEDEDDTTTTQDDYEQEHSDSPADEDTDSDDEGWARACGEIDPDDSASASAEPPYFSARRSDRSRAPRVAGQRHPSRQHSIPRPRQPRAHQHPPPQIHAPPFAPVPGSDYMAGAMASDNASEFYSSDPRGHFAPPGAAAAAYYDTHRRPGYPHSGVSGFGHPSPYGGQVVPWAGSNPFTPHGSYYERGHEMLPYQHQAPGFFGGAGPVSHASYGMPHHLQHMMYSNPPAAPPATTVGGPKTPEPEDKKPDPEFEKIKEQLKQLQLERATAEEAKRQADVEKKIREDAERQFKERMEAMREAQEAAKKEIEVARIAAEAAALERLEEARKAEEERRRVEAELKAQAAREERERIENERREEEKRQREHALALEKAERDAREKYEAAKAAEEERRVELEQQRLLIEAQAKEKLLADQKAAEEARIAAEAKAAEDKARKELAEKEAKQKAIEEYEAKMAEEKKAAEDQAKAEAAAKLRFADEARLAAEAAAAAEEQKKKDDEELKKRILAEAKAAEEKAAAEKAPASEAEKEPVKFKDAVGRKYSFPFRLASKWPTMERLIYQAFEHIDDLGPHVHEGHYDLEGPEGELILKEIWDTTIQPGWQITMKMWPLQQHPLRGHARGHGGARHGFPEAIHIPPNIPPEQRQAFIQAILRRNAQAAAGGAAGHRYGQQQAPQRMAAGMNVPGMAGPRPPVPPDGARFPMFGQAGPGPVPGGVDIVDVGREGKRGKSGDRKKKAAMSWFGGGAPARKHSKKKR